MPLSAILQILNLALPALSSVIVAIKGVDGSGSAIVYLDQADANAAANQVLITDWMTAHGKVAAVAPKPAA